LALLEGVGFQLKQSAIFWVYRTGFPKAYDVSKGIDRRNNRTNEDFIKLGKYLKEKRIERNISTIQLGEHFKTHQDRVNHGGCVSNWENALNIPTPEQWIKLKQLLDLSNKFDYIIERVEAERNKMGESTNKIQFEKLGNAGYKEKWDITSPSLDEAKKWEGWKSQTGMKPAVEVVIQAQKPFGSYQPMFLLVANLLISLSGDEADWLKLIALTAIASSTSSPPTSNEGGVNSAPSTARTSTNIKRFNADSVEKYLQWSNHPNSSSVPENVPEPIIQALVTRLGREVGSSEAMAISQYMSGMENTGSNTLLLWKNTLVALLLKMSSATTRTRSATITELKILNSLLCQSTSLSIIRVKEIIQNGRMFDALSVENCFKSVFLQLSSIPFTSVPENALKNMEKPSLTASNAENPSRSLNSTRILESIAHGTATIKPVPKSTMILMVNKPRSEPTIVENVLRWGTGAMNVDACRIPFQNEDEDKLDRVVTREAHPDLVYGLGKDQHRFTKKDYSSSKGRFPANLIISDGALDTGETTKSRKNENASPTHFEAWRRKEGRTDIPSGAITPSYGDEGSPFRFFDLDAWAVHHGFLDVPKPSRAERDFGLWEYEKKDANKWNPSGIGARRREAGLGMGRNVHPTVKPVKLMAYLIELGCPKDGVVVDPFLGSGTTCIAAKRLRRKWIGVEMSPEYAAIAEARINIRGPMDQYLEASG